MPIKFSTFESYFENYHPHLLLYAWNGVGKTTLIGKTGLRTVLLDCGDAGVATLRQADRSRMKIVKIKTTDHYLEVMAELNRRAEGIDLIVPDTLSGLYKKAVREVKGKGKEMNQKKWGQAVGKVIECISETELFPHDVVYLAQEKRSSKGGGDTAFMNVGPSLSPGVREYLSGNIDWIGRLFIEDEKRKLSFLLTEDVEAKDRGNLFPKVITLGKPELAYKQIRQRIVEGMK